MAPKILVVDDNQELRGLLTQLLDEAGYQVVGAGKGKAAVELSKTEQPQLAVIDLLLPDMMGYHVADALRRTQPELPLIFITGVFKGGKHAIEARTKYSAAGFFEKPFESAKLLETVRRLVAPEKREPAAEKDAFEVELDIDVNEDLPQDSMELTGRIKVTGGDNISAELRGANLTATAAAPVVVRAAPAGMPALAGPTTAQDPSSRRGELRDNLPSLITAFYLAKENGELGLQKGKVKKVVYFEKGQPVFALSNLVSDRFAQFLVRVGRIKPDQLQEATDFATSTKRRIGDVLVERGMLKDTERLYYVGQQVKSIIYSLFAWEEGTFVMSFKAKGGAEAIKLDVHPANLITRGIKKLYKPERLARLLSPEERLLPSLQPSYALNEVDLERWEAELLPKIDGTRNVGELLAISGKPEHMLLGFLYAMTTLAILEKRT